MHGARPGVVGRLAGAAGPRGHVPLQDHLPRPLPPSPERPSARGGANPAAEKPPPNLRGALGLRLPRRARAAARARARAGGQPPGARPGRGALCRGPHARRRHRRRSQRPTRAVRAAARARAPAPGRPRRPPTAHAPAPPPPRPSRSGAPAAAAGGQRLTTNDALTYLRDVKNKFAARKDVYDTFLEIMKEFKAQRWAPGAGEGGGGRGEGAGGGGPAGARARARVAAPRGAPARFERHPPPPPPPQHRHDGRDCAREGPVQGPQGAHPRVQHLPAQGAARGGGGGAAARAPRGGGAGCWAPQQRGGCGRGAGCQRRGSRAAAADDRCPPACPAPTPPGL